MEKQRCVNTLRLLSVEQIERANSGHPGIALGAAPVLFVLFDSVMKYNAKNPNWFNRDRFVLSAGHGSSLLYATLHLFGYGVSKEDLKQFRKIDNITPGHPEHGLTPGVEASTGPLGQGVANAVGMAIASRHLGSTFNTEDIKLLDNHIFCLASDGCFMEGVAHEAMSLAGSLQLSNLTIIYDSNNITIDGATDLAFVEDTAKKFEAMGFFVQTVEDGNDLNELEQKLLLSKAQNEKPSLVIVKTVIGYGAPLEGTNKVHGQPLSKDEIEVLKQNLGFEKKAFEVPQDVLEYATLRQTQNEKLEENWNILLEEYKTKYLGQYEQFMKYINQDYKKTAVQKLKKLEIDASLSLRDMGHTVLQELKTLLPNTIGGTADVAPSTKAYFKGVASFGSLHTSGKNLHFGIREHAMASVCNGIALYGGLNTFASTYLIFTDYMKAGMRMSALMHLPVLYYVTHDSVLIGQDGATHQSCEQLIGLRAMPNMVVFRPCNAAEVLAGYIHWLEGYKPLTLVLAKPAIKAKQSEVKDALKGGYILSKERGKLEIILIATGTEVEPALTAQELLHKEGIGTRVVSMPSFEVFDMQSESYQNKVLPRRAVRRVAIEAGSKYSFYKYVGTRGKIIGVDEFGHSGTPEELLTRFKLDAANIVAVAKTLL